MHMVVFVTSVLVTMSSAEMTNDTALDYCKQYNYTGENAPDPRLASLVNTDPDRALYECLMTFQTMWHLEITGALNNETSTMMEMERCGMADVYFIEDLVMTPPDEGGSRKRKKRFAIQGSRWPEDRIRSLTWNVLRYTPDMSQAEVDAELTRAFEVWEAVSPLRFVRSVAATVDMEIIFQAGEHGDRFPFDGPGRTLAHAFFPQFGGDSHFDDAELYTFGVFTGTNLFQVAAHEFGHALGLSHSDIEDALMYPFYRGYQPNFSLDWDDIAGIQAIYGPPDTLTPPGTTPGSTAAPTATTLRPDRPDVCSQASIDAIANHVVDGEVATYMFRGDQVYRLNAQGRIMSDYPKDISSEFVGLPSDLDAALYWPPRYQFDFANGMVERSPAQTLFFKGDQVWAYRNRQLQATYPKQISEALPGVPDNIDAAFVWTGNGRTYFTAGDLYYRYNYNLGAVDRLYPRPLRVWRGVPATVDAVFNTPTLPPTTVFFSGDQYYVFRDRTFRAGSANPTATWLGCNALFVSDRGSMCSISSVAITCWCVILTLTKVF